MPVLTHSVEIDAPAAAVYAIAREVELFPEFMPEVRKTTVLERSDDNTRTVVAWEGLIPAFHVTVRWVEEDIWDDVEFTCRFSQLKGDFTEYGGLWRFVPLGECCRFESELRYELDIPTVGPLIRGVVRKIMNLNVERLQGAIKRRAEGAR